MSRCAIIIFHICVYGVISLCLSSCASKPIPIQFNCPRIMLPPDPIEATKKLTAKSSPDTVAKAWVATTTEYKGWNIIVRKQLRASK